MKKGEITVFLSLLFVLMVSFILAVAESAVLQTAKNEARLYTDQAVYSVFGEFQRELQERYGIFAVEGSYESGDFREERITNRMHYYGSPEIEHEITGIQFLTDSSGRPFREQAIRYMEEVYGIEVIKDLTGLSETWEEQQIVGKDTEVKSEKLSEDLDALLSETESSLPAQDNPLPNIEKIRKTGITALVFPKEKQISGKSISSQSRLCSRDIRSGRGSFPARTDLDTVTGRLLFHEYILKKFSHVLSEETGIRQDQTLDYEVEYILEGKEKDADNLEAVLRKLMVIRTGINYAYLQTDAAKQAEAEALALTLSSLIGLPVITEAVKQVLLAAWAFGESIMDLRALMGGKRAALVKNSDNWQLGLSALLTLGTEADTRPGSDVQNGMNYQEHLRLLLFLESGETAAIRALDRIEQNLVYTQKLEFFRADACVTRIKIQNCAKIREGLTYEFPLYFSYE